MEVFHEKMEQFSRAEIDGNYSTQWRLFRRLSYIVIKLQISSPSSSFIEDMGIVLFRIDQKWHIKVHSKFCYWNIDDTHTNTHKRNDSN